MEVLISFKLFRNLIRGVLCNSGVVARKAFLLSSVYL
jgi:hypothetical protein